MSSSSLLEKIIFASQIYTISIYPIVLISGLIGNICNIIVFCCFTLFQRNQCAFYLLVESISNCLLLVIVLPFRTSELVFDYDPTQISLVWCKLRQAIVASFSLLSFSCICFAAIDQYLSTNCHVYLRQISTLKLSHRLIYFTSLILILYQIPFLIYFKIQPTFGCSISNEAFTQFFSYVHFCLFSAILPITISTLFAGLAYGNVRHIVRRQMPIVRRRLDRQVTKMVLTKVIFLVITTLPFVIVRIYKLNVPDHQHDLVRVAIEQLIFTITCSFFYINSAGTFYVFLMVSKRFRRQVKHALVKNIRKKKLFITKDHQRSRHNQVGAISDGADLERD